MSREVMKQALEALESDNLDIQLRAAIALRAALDAPTITFNELADEMVSLGLIDASAIEDPDLYDDARTLQAVEALQRFIAGEKA